MYPHIIHAFVDGGYLREMAKRHKGKLLNPRGVVKCIAESGPVQTWAYDPSRNPNAFLARVHFYDAIPENDAGRKEAAEQYWKAVELLDDVHLGFGALRGLKRNMRQKGVDTLLAVDLLVGAFEGLFDVAILIAGDADFVPVVEEAKRRGVMVTLAGLSDSVADDLRRASDRFVELQLNDQWLPTMGGTNGPWDA